MSISFGEILAIFLVGILFFKPQEIKEFLSSFFSMKRNLEKEVDDALKQFSEEDTTPAQKQSIEFFEIEDKCQKQQ